jgi:hypothetical protein
MNINIIYEFIEFDLVYTVQVHRHAPPPRAHSCLYDFHLVEFSHQPVLSQ